MKVTKEDILWGKIYVLSGYNIDKNSLVQYYRLMYPGRAAFLELYWDWLYRTYFLECKLPVALLIKGKLIAHGGMIPMNLLIRNIKVKAGWLVDLSVLPDYQRNGLASFLINRRIELTDIQMTFPNNKSLSIFKKKGWNCSIKTYLHYVFIYPFNHPWFVRKLPISLRSILNYFYFHLFAFFNNNYADPDWKNCLNPLNEELLVSLYNKYIEYKTKVRDIITPQRDMDYIRWRILNSPNKDKYMIYKKNSFIALVFLNMNISIDILWVTDLNNLEEIRNTVSNLAVYGRKQRFSYIRILTTNRKLSKYINTTARSFVTHPPFFFHVNNSELAREMQGLHWEIGLIDSDFEFLD